MGDSSLDSRDYQRVAQVADLVSRGVLAIKRSSLHIPSTVPEAESSELRSTLSSVLRALLVALSEHFSDTPGQRESVLKARALLSSELVENLKKSRSDDLPDFITELHRVAEALSRPTTVELDESEIRVLDEVAGAADAEASRVYRRMLRT